VANEEQLKFVRQGPDAWSAWRDKNPPMRADLAEADLNGTNFRGAILRGANVSGAKNLARADLV
jgi:uncharacterized protein YjbI with pentapeptide repeats